MGYYNGRKDIRSDGTSSLVLRIIEMVEKFSHLLVRSSNI